MQKIMKNTNCDAVKLENYQKNYKIVELLVKKKNSCDGSYWVHPTI